MLNPRALTHDQLADIDADVQAILWQESRMLPDDPRPPDFMPVDLAAQLYRPMVIDANELLWWTVAI